MAEKLSLSLVWSLLLSGGPTPLYREELGTRLDFAGFFSSSPLSPLFPRVLLSGNHPMQEGFSHLSPQLLPAWLEDGQSLQRFSSRGASWEVRQEEEHSHPRRPTSSAHEKPQDGVRHVGIVSERRGLSSGLLCLSNAAPGDSVAARDFWPINYLIPSSHVVFSPECSSPANAQACVWGEWGWAGGCRAGAEQRTPARKQHRGWGAQGPPAKALS